MRLRWARILALALFLLAAHGATSAADQRPVRDPGRKAELRRKPVAELDATEVKRELLRTRRLLRNKEMFRGLRNRYSPEEFRDLFRRNKLEAIPFPRATVIEREIVDIKEYIAGLEIHAVSLGLMDSAESGLRAVYETAPPTPADADKRPFVPMEDKAMRDAADAVVAIIAREAFDVSADGKKYTIKEPTERTTPAGSTVTFCESVDFIRTMSVKQDHFWGTGFLIEYEPDPESVESGSPGYEGPVIVTAGHVTATDFLDEVYFVFGYRLNGDGSLRTKYTDKEVRVGTAFTRHPGEYDDERDFAIIQLAATGSDDELVPLSFRENGLVPAGTNVYMIGHPLGMPQMVTRAAAIKDGYSCLSFDAPLESYDFNSGSPVMSLAEGAVGMVEGILRDSPDDFEQLCDCSVISKSADSGTDETTIVRITQVVDWLERGEQIEIINNTEIMVSVNSTIELGPGETRVIDYTYNLWVSPLAEIVVAAAAEAEGSESEAVSLEECDVSWDPERGSAWRVVMVEGQLHMDECPPGTGSSEL